MWLTLTNLLARADQATDEEMKFLNDYLSFEEPRARFTQAYKTHRWDGRFRLFNTVSRTFPTGLLPLLRKGAARAGFKVEVSDARVRPAPDPAYQAAWLDPVREQPQALAACLNHGRGIIWAPTGSGKTEVISACAHVVREPWVIFVSKKDLLTQHTARFLARTGEEAGVVGDGVWNPRRVTVAMMQTLSRGLKTAPVRDLLLKARGVVSDECHELPADSFRAVVNSTPNAFYRFGFSGTPLARGDQRNVLLVAATGEVIYRVKAQKLIDAGVLSRPTVRLVPVRQEVAGDTWDEVYRVGVSCSEKRNKAVLGVTAKAAKPALLFIRETDHGYNLLRECQRMGMKAEFVFGKHSRPQRNSAIKRLQRGDIEVLICSVIFDTGIDIPEVRSVINAYGGKSVIKTVQRVGRGMRVTLGKGEVEVWDFDDQGNLWLEDHSRIRKGTYLAEGYPVIELPESEAQLLSSAA